MSPDRLIYMANQIGKFFQSQGHDKAVPGIADHIRKFWDPRMRSAIFAHLDAGGAGLDPNVRDALETLKNAQTQSSSGPRRYHGRERINSRASGRRALWRVKVSSTLGSRGIHADIDCRCAPQSHDPRTEHHHRHKPCGLILRPSSAAFPCRRLDKRRWLMI